MENALNHNMHVIYMAMIMSAPQCDECVCLIYDRVGEFDDINITECRVVIKSLCETCVFVFGGEIWCFLASMHEKSHDSMEYPSPWANALS